MKEVVIVSAARTGFGSFGGSLVSLSATELGVVAATAAIERAGIDKAVIDEAIIGNVISAGLGQNVARQVAINAGLNDTSPAFSVNMVCGSGLKAIALATQSIMMGDSDVILCGGTESMSNAPYLLNKNRWGARMGNDTVEDSMIKDGLWEIFNDYHMGVTAENIAEQWKISREAQDAFAVKSQNKAEAAQKAGKFKDEIVPVYIPQRKGDPICFDTDEFVKHGVTLEKVAKLRPAFKKDGTVTAGNASGINDGAAMFIVMSKEKAVELGVKPLAKIIATASAGVDPSIMGYGPAPASKKVVEKAGLTLDDIDLFELNEAFASQSLAVIGDLGIDTEKVNVNGGAIAIGHPVGASGARITVTLLYEMMKRDDCKLGLAALCIGGGMGTSIILEKM